MGEQASETAKLLRAFFVQRPKHQAVCLLMPTLGVLTEIQGQNGRNLFIGHLDCASLQTCKVRGGRAKQGSKQHTVNQTSGVPAALVLAKFPKATPTKKSVADIDRISSAAQLYCEGVTCADKQEERKKSTFHLCASE